MSRFKRVEAATDVRRPFAITLGLVEGYHANARRHSVDEVIEIVKQWMQDRSARGEPFLSGTVTAEGTLIYAWNNGLNETGTGTEPSVSFHGDVSPLHHAELLDHQIKALLDELAGILGARLNQNHVYVTYRNAIWVLEAEPVLA